MKTKNITKGQVPTFDMPSIGKRLLTQNNRITQDPIFLVEQKKRVWGIDPDYSDLITWIKQDDDYGEVSPQKRRALEQKYESGEGTKGYRRVGYIERWEYVQACFTEAAAQLYIDENRHNLKEPRIYAASGYRNKEWIAVRAYLKSLAPTEASLMPGAEMQLAVGSTVWQRQCVYGAKSERENWVPMKIIRETCRSWIVGPEWDQEKIPKKGARKQYWAFSEAEIDDVVIKQLAASYVAENARRIANAVSYCTDPAKLRQIAEIVGWKEVSDGE